MLWRLISRLWKADGDPPAGEAPDPHDTPGDWLRRARAHHARNELVAALECYRACAAAQPENLNARSGIAHVLSAAWRIEECICACEDALRVSPNSPEIFSGLLLYSHFAARPDPKALFALHQRYGELMSAGTPAACPARSAMPGDAERALRIGYVSRDFCTHSVAAFIEPVIAHHDRSRHAVYCYYTRADRDPTTDRFASLADAWRHVGHESADTLAARIHADGIDVLVDLGGHTLGNSLAVFARRPAPVQCSWIGYPDTTGLPAMDYRITDAIVDPPPDADALHSERLLRVPPPFLCYQPPVDSPALMPRGETGGVVFGSFNVIMKVNEPLVDLWAQILAEVPNSRLIVKSTLIEYGETAARVCDRFAARGIPADRLELRPWTQGRAEHLAAYNEIDIALDTFPYNGTTTTCEALWMGVPVVTLSGETHMSRVGATLLASVGLEALVARDARQYVAVAVALAFDAPRRARLAASLRDRLVASPLLDHAAFTVKIESAYRTAWRAWCASHAARDADTEKHAVDEPSG